jgi:hypothetical protein
MSYVTVSPNFTSVDLKSIDLSMKIDIFEDQMNGWFLDHVELLASPTNPKAQHAGFAILTFAAIYVESIACFIKGSTSDGKSSEYFTFGMGQIFAGFARFDADSFIKVWCEAKLALLGAPRSPFRSVAMPVEFQSRSRSTHGCS